MPRKLRRLSDEEARSLRKRREKIEKRALALGGLIVTYRGEMFVIAVSGVRVIAAHENGRHYASGIWRIAYVHWENERALSWRLLDRIDVALRRRSRSLGEEKGLAISG